ncbi:hypothetical protein CCP3SC5AM1_290016 [Gammaproteobacteria bacterium]
MEKRLLYEILPFFYSACGVIAILLSSEFLAKISGLLLITAAMIIFHFRLEYRRQRAEKAEKRLIQAQVKLSQSPQDPAGSKGLWGDLHG